MDAIVIMAKAPLPDKVKTRLTPFLDPQTACRLYRLFLLDKIEQVRSIKDAQHFVAFTPVEYEDLIRSILPAGFQLIKQHGDELGERLANVSGDLFDRGFKKILLLDSDTPDLPPQYIQQAIIQLNDVDVVLGPCEDGGYYLIGMRKKIPSIFKEIPWSTSMVTELTVKKAQSTGATVSQLNKWYDVDTIEDLRRLKRKLDAFPYPKNSLNTYSLLSKLKIER